MLRESRGTKKNHQTNFLPFSCGQKLIQNEKQRTKFNFTFILSLHQIHRQIFIFVTILPVKFTTEYCCDCYRLLCFIQQVVFTSMFHEQITIFSSCVWLLIPKSSAGCLPSSSFSSTHCSPFVVYVYMCMFRRFNSTFSLEALAAVGWFCLFTHLISHCGCVQPSFGLCETSNGFINTHPRHFSNHRIQDHIFIWLKIWLLWNSVVKSLINSNLTISNVRQQKKNQIKKGLYAIDETKLVSTRNYFECFENDCDKKPTFEQSVTFSTDQHEASHSYSRLNTKWIQLHHIAGVKTCLESCLLCIALKWLWYNKFINSDELFFGTFVWRCLFHLHSVIELIYVAIRTLPGKYAGYFVCDQKFPYKTTHFVINLEK